MIDPPADDNVTCADIEQYWQKHKSELIDGFANKSSSFVSNLLPPAALTMPVPEAIGILKGRYGSEIDRALSWAATEAPPATPGAAAPPHEQLHSSYPGARADNPSWIRRSNVAGINVRTVGSFWRVVHYCLTLPGSINAIHLLPIWEPGVIGSLYGMASWEINDEFIDPELATLLPELNTAEKQLKATINVLHLCGRAVGMDVIPHTDRFSQIVLAQPSLFEWLRRDNESIVDHRANLHEDVEDLVYRFVSEIGPADGWGAANQTKSPPRDRFFSDEVDEDDRNRILFGDPADRDGRNARRGAIIRLVGSLGFEPVPATMGPPYRGIEVDPESATTDSSGHVWLDYRITKPQSMSRVFGPLTRYKLYERLDDNRDWQIDFDRPRGGAWDYVSSHYATIQERFGFDFMRGDMSHVQMRPDGVPADVPEEYDLLGHVKRRISRRVRSFAYFAESFLAPPGVMAYGDEIDHLEACDADVTLGDLQSVPVASDDFARRLRQYLDIAGTRGVTPSFTVMTGDKDDPRFDSNYLAGNELRMFCTQFLADLPSYIALGFELRDQHKVPARNEFYSKLYVFQVRSGRLATRGPYQFGTNAGLFLRLQRIGRLAERVGPAASQSEPVWLLPPDPTAGRKAIAWATVDTRDDSASVIRTHVANCDTVAPARNLLVPLRAALKLCAHTAPRIVATECIFESVPGSASQATRPAKGGFHIPRLGRGECRIYETSVRNQSE